LHVNILHRLVDVIHHLIDIIPIVVQILWHLGKTFCNIIIWIAFRLFTRVPEVCSHQWLILVISSSKNVPNILCFRKLRSIVLLQTYLAQLQTRFEKA
jgi:hypothetical protein